MGNGTYLTRIMSGFKTFILIILHTATTKIVETATVCILRTSDALIRSLGPIFHGPVILIFARKHRCS